MFSIKLLLVIPGGSIYINMKSSSEPFCFFSRYIVICPDAYKTFVITKIMNQVMSKVTLLKTISSLMYFINHLLHCYCHHPEVVAALLDPQALQTL